jgi:hypothetical protein
MNCPSRVREDGVIQLHARRINLEHAGGKERLQCSHELRIVHSDCCSGSSLDAGHRDRGVDLQVSKLKRGDAEVEDNSRTLQAGDQCAILHARARRHERRARQNERRLWECTSWRARREHRLRGRHLQCVIPLTAVRAVAVRSVRERAVVQRSVARVYVAERSRQV